MKLTIFLLSLCCLLITPPVSGTTIRAGGDAAYPPFEFMNDQGAPDGVTVEVVRAVADVMDLDITITLGPWQEMRHRLEEGSIDLLTGLLRTESREKHYDFSIPYFAMSYAVFVRETDSPSDLQEILNSRIILQQGDAAHEYILEHHPDSTMILAESYPDAIQILLDGGAEGILMPRILGMLVNRDMEQPGIRAAGEPVFQHNYSLAVRKGDTQLLYLLNEGLSILKAEGTFDEIYQSWFDLTYRQGVSLEDVLIYILWVALPLGAVILLVLFWSWSLRRQVRNTSRDLNREFHERTQAQRELDTSRETLHAVVNLVPHLIFLVDQSKRLLLVNRALLEFFGRSPEDPPKHVDELGLQDEEVKLLFKTAEKVFADAAQQDIPRHRLIDTSGTKRWMHTSMLPFTSASGDEMRLLGISMEITNLLDLEEQLLQSRKLEAVGQLAGGVAHDFNNQLTGVLGFAELLVSELENQQHLEYAQHILTAAEHAADLTKKLLSFARRGHYQARYISLHDMIQQVTSILSHSMDKRIVITERLEATSDSLFADPAHVQNMVLNIALNARDAMPSGGELLLSSWNRSIDPAHGEDLSGPVICLEIRDTGVGMTEEVRSRIFEPFYTTKEQGKGTGMGLASVYGSIQQIGGVITVESTPGLGSSFLLKLPLASDPKILDTLTSPDKKYKQFDKRMILAIDDEQVFLQSLKAQLVPEGCRVIGLTDPLEGIRYFREHFRDVDAVILDMLMPGLSGEQPFPRL